MENSNERASKGFVTTFALPRTLVAVGKFRLDLDICEGLFERRTGASDSYRFAPHYATGVGLVMEVASFGFKTRKTHFHLDLMHTRKSRPKFNEVRWEMESNQLAIVQGELDITALLGHTLTGVGI